MPPDAVRLIVGLGNPGDEHARTRHNAGFWLIDELARRHGGDLRADRRHQGEIVRVDIAGQAIWLLKPMTYMNRSGGPLGSLADFHRIAPAEILVVHDELDLEPGTARFKEGGGHGGHNGLRDVIARIGEGFWRARVGIGHPGDRSQVVDYVLKRAGTAEDTLIRDTVDRVADLVPVFLTDGAQKAMHRLHTPNP